MQEIVFKLNTREGQETFTTNNIKGSLNSLIIKSLEKVEIIIESELGYLVYHDREFEGIEYIPIRQRTRAPIQSLIDRPEFVPFFLNEKLIITLRGRRDHEVDFILRIG